MVRFQYCARRQTARLPPPPCRLATCMVVVMRDRVILSFEARAVHFIFAPDLQTYAE